MWNAIKAAVTAVVNGIKNTISSVWNSIKSTVSSVVNSIKNTVTTVFNNIWSGIKNTMGKIVSSIKECFNNAISFITSLPSKVLQWGNNYCDTVSIMSYGMAWSGSAPGPVSPRSWLEGIYDYAVKVMNPDKVFLGMPAYEWNWRIHDTPKNMGVTYRGTSNTYYKRGDVTEKVYTHKDIEQLRKSVKLFDF